MGFKFHHLQPVQMRGQLSIRFPSSHWHSLSLLAIVAQLLIDVLAQVKSKATCEPAFSWISTYLSITFKPCPVLIAALFLFFPTRWLILRAKALAWWGHTCRPHVIMGVSSFPSHATSHLPLIVDAFHRLECYKVA